MAITDLTGTKWQMPIDLSTFLANGSFYSVNGLVTSTIDNSSFSFSFSRIDFGEDTLYKNVKFNNGGKPYVIRNANTGGSSWHKWQYISTDGYGSMLENPIISIYGGQNVTNQNLIAWFEANATQIIEPQTEDEYINEIGLAAIRDWVKSKLYSICAFVVDTANPCR